MSTVSCSDDEYIDEEDSEEDSDEENIEEEDSDEKNIEEKDFDEEDSEEEDPEAEDSVVAQPKRFPGDATHDSLRDATMPREASTDDNHQETAKLWLEGVSIELKGERPKARLKLVITTDEETSEHEIEKAEPIRWVGILDCRKNRRILIRLYRRRLLGHKFVSSTVIFLSANEQEAEIKHDKDWAKITLTFSNIEPGAVGSERVAVNAARQVVEKQRVLLDLLGKLEHVRGSLKSIKEIGDMAKEIHPYIGSACSAVFLLYEACEKQEKCRDAARDLVQEVDDFLNYGYEELELELKERKETQKIVKKIAELIEKICKYIVENNNNMLKTFFRDFFSPKYKNDLQKYLTELRRMKEALRDCVSFGIWIIVNDTGLENKLNVARKAHYAPSEACLTGTREELLARVIPWVNNLRSPKARWVYGLAGSGKSAVANSVCKMLEEKKIPFTCFTCSRDDPDLKDAKRVLPTIAYSLAQYYADFRGAITSLMQSPAGRTVASGDPKSQSKDLFGKSFVKLAVSGERRPRFHVLVIDALDECGTSDERRALAECLVQMAHKVPWIKLFVTSRPEPEIRAVFKAPVSNILATDINAEAQTNDDIQRFIEARSKDLELALSDDDVTRLVRQASGLFIWCATVFRYVSGSQNKTAVIREFLTGDHPPMEHTRRIHCLYGSILALAIPESYPEDKSLMHTVIGIVYVANRPLTDKAIGDFLTKGEGREEKRKWVKNIIDSLHAVLYRDPGMGNAIRACHPSFLDYIAGMLNGSELESSERTLSIDYLHQLLFKASLATMHRELKFNICELENSYHLNKDVPDIATRISDSIPESLQYSSLFWFTHLSESKLPSNSEDILSTVSSLLESPKALFWAEILSLLGAVGRGIIILRECSAFFVNEAQISSIAFDLERFIMAYAEAMESAPHIYLSALSWLPENTQLHSSIAKLFKHLPMVVHKEETWEGARWVKSVGTSVYCVAYSPDGRFFAAGLNDCTVRIFNAHTYEPVGHPLKRHSDPVTSVAFSPDGRLVASSVPRDKFIRIWDVESGGVVKTLRGYSHLVISVSFSPDGGMIASGSSDGAIGFWHVKTGLAVGSSFTGHGSNVNCIAFSVDGKRLISGSDDKTVRIWNAFMGTQIGEPLSGHSDHVLSVAYSRDGRMIASGSSDHTVRIWNAENGALIQVLTRHTDWVRSVCFSPDGKHIVSGSSDRSICVWNIETGSLVRNPLTGHSSRVHAVAFSVDGQSILSGSNDKTLRIWDIESSATADDTLSGHSEGVLCVTYSPNGQYIASSSYDKTIRIWDALTGEAIGEPLQQHSGIVNSIAFSTNGRQLVSASNDGNLFIWDTTTWSISGKPFLGHSDPVCSAVISPNNRLIASSSKDKTVRLWDMKTREVVRELEGHTGNIASVSFFPDRQCIASGSHDKTIRIWDTQTGNAIGQPLEGHSRRVRAVAVSPSGHLVASGSSDQTVRLWDTKTGQVLHMLKGHSLAIQTVSFSPDGQHLVSCSRDCTIRVWNIESGKAVGEPLHGHSNWVFSATFSPDGQRIVSGAGDKIIRVWDAQMRINQDSLDKHRAQWNACRAHMAVENGWVKDGDKLLLWVPMQYRYDNLSGFELAIGEGVRRIRPKVDVEKLLEYSGARWTDIYSP